MSNVPSSSVASYPANAAGDDANIFIVSNRGPHDFVWDDGHWVARAASGGLVSMVAPLARQPNVAWFCAVSEPLGSEGERHALYTTAKDQTDAELNVVPVPLPADMYQQYYGAISNEVLWMLQHHLVGQFGYDFLDAARHQAWENGYLSANRAIADAIAATEIPVRAFLLQDYHLYPLPALLRERFPRVPSLHFIHIPFPEPTMMKLIPRTWREGILRGLLGADVVGLQTQADVRAFLGCCEEILGCTVDHDRRVIIQAGHNVRVRAFPASVNPEEVRAVAESPAVAAARENLARSAAVLSVIRVDRLDPSKNQVLGFAAFGRLLESHPELRGRVRFLAFLIPSRTDLTVYREYHDAVFAEIARVNERWSAECGFPPIEVFYTNDRAQAFAAMERCDALLVNSREDGMNLVAKEWAILSQKPGVLIVSETAGVAADVTDESGLLVSPLDVEGTAQALATALLMPVAERAARLAHFRQTVEKWTARDWLRAQLKELGVDFTPAALPAPRPTAVPTDGSMVEQELTVQNAYGIHARPAAAWVRCARGFTSKLEIIRDGQAFSAQSISDMLTLNLQQGATFILRATGPDAATAVQALHNLLAQLASGDAVMASKR
jgi:trehalose 6-phosphate synthase